MKNKLFCCNLWIVFKTKCKLTDCFVSKDNIPLFSVRELFINLGTVAVMLLVVAK